MTYWVHLVKRFVGSLRPGGPTERDEAWARSTLFDGETSLWERMSGPDRRHAVAVARRSQDLLGDRADRAVLAAALLHDVGKIESGLGPFRRAGATLVVELAGYDRAQAWRERPRGVRSRIGRYVCHDRIGADLLAEAGSHELTISWAREHHLPPGRWTLQADISAALKAADDD